MRVPMGGQCDHCGRTSTPCWRKGPPEKPCLCNACGVRWLVKHSLEGYMPAVKPQAQSSNGQAAAAAPASADPKRAAAAAAPERGLRKRKDRSATPDDTDPALRHTLFASRSVEQPLQQQQQRASNSREEAGEGDVFMWGGAAQQLESDSSQQPHQGHSRQQKHRQDRRQCKISAAAHPSASRKHRQPALHLLDIPLLPPHCLEQYSQEEQQAVRAPEQYELQAEQQYSSTSFNLEQYGLQYALMGDLDLDLGPYGSLELEGCGGEASAQQQLPGSFLPLFSSKRKQLNQELMSDLADAASSLTLLHHTSRHLFARPVKAPRRPRKQARPVACC